MGCVVGRDLIDQRPQQTPLLDEETEAQLDFIVVNRMPIFVSQLYPVQAL